MNDYVDQVIQDYLSYLEDGAPEPSLDHLTPEDRALAEDLINSLNAGRGIDPYQSRPSLDALLRGTELEDVLAVPTPMGLSLDAVRIEIVSSLGSASEPIVDAAAQAEGIQSDAVVRFGALRIRVQFRDDVSTLEGLSQIDPRTSAGPVFGRFPETAAVVVVIGDPEFSSVAIDPYDTEEFIGTPDGRTYPPRLTRPILPLYDTLRRLVDDLAPDLSVDADDRHQPIDLTAIIHSECSRAQAMVVSEGKKARTEAKKETWHAFDEHQLLVTLCEEAAAGELTESDLDKRITAAAAAA